MSKNCRECGTVFEIPKGPGNHRKQFCSLQCGAKHRYKVRASVVRKSSLKRRYGLSESDFAVLKEQQNDKCVICLNQPETLYVDHCHTTLKVRGLLCMKCNCLLGLAKDNKELLSRAVSYLDKSLTYKDLKAMGEI